ncbi:MAG: carboxypeptidase-like regulatory domain-containing protein, partial [Thermofilaceae archaeon]
MGRKEVYAILMLLLAAQIAVSAPLELSFEVAVVDSLGKPVEGAIVVFINARTLGAAYMGRTDSSGRLEGFVQSGEYYLLYVVKVEEGRLTHLPVKVDLTGYPRAQNLEVRAVLYPAARINVTGRIVYIGEAYAGRVRVQILDKYGVPLSKSLKGGEVVVQDDSKITKMNSTVVDLYGATLDYTALKRGLGYAPLKETEALIPIDYPVVARVNYLLVMLRESTLKDLFIDFGSFENPLVLSSSQDVFTVDLLKTSLEGQIRSVKMDLDSARALIHGFETLGFYIPEMNDLLKRGEEYVQAAEERFARGGRPEEILPLLEASSALANDQIPKQLGFIRDVAKAGAVIMPSFIAVFAAVLAFYFFDRERAKVIGFSIVYMLFVVAFAYLYPGFRLLWSLDRSLFLLTVGGAYALFVIAVFALPRIIKEPELPSEIALGGLIAVAFTLGKRYSKIRVFRTVIMIFSIAAFIWAFTVLATFGTVYAKIEEKDFATYPENVLTIKRAVNGVPQPLNPDLDALLFEGRKDIAYPYFIVYNRPDERLEIIVSYAGLERIVHFAVGVDREEFRLNPLFLNAVTLYKAFDNNSVILPSSIWTSLGLKGGEPVYILVKGERLQLKAAGYFDESLINEWSNPDGSPLKPFIIREGKPVYANSSDFLIAHYSLLMRLLPQFEGGYSSIFLPYQISAEPLGEEQGWLFANEVVDRRGENYIA